MGHPILFFVLESRLLQQLLPPQVCQLLLGVATGCSLAQVSGCVSQVCDVARTGEEAAAGTDSRGQDRKAASKAAEAQGAHTRQPACVGAARVRVCAAISVGGAESVCYVLLECVLGESV